MQKIIAFMCMIFLFCSCGNETFVKHEDTPKQILDSIAAHFPNRKVVNIKSETNEVGEMKYKLMLGDATKVEFDAIGKIIEAESDKQLPDAIIPHKILNYIKTNYAANHITRINLEDMNSKDIRLNSGLMLEFDNDNNFVKIED